MWDKNSLRRENKAVAAPSTGRFYNIGSAVIISSVSKAKLKEFKALFEAYLAVLHVLEVSNYL